jgi:hypothetical protein
VDENGLYSGLRAAIRRDGSAEPADAPRVPVDENEFDGQAELGTVRAAVGQAEHRLEAAEAELGQGEEALIDESAELERIRCESGAQAALRAHASGRAELYGPFSDAPRAAVAAALAELDACRERLRDTEAQLEIALALVVAARARES